MLLVGVLFVCDIAVGSVCVSPRNVFCALLHRPCPDIEAAIVRDIRLPKALAAVIVGGALSVSGLQMQTLFRNPLAGPYVLGISSGASLGAALFVIGAPLAGVAGALSPLGIAGAAWLGSAFVLVVMGLCAAKMRDIMAVLILGMMLSSGIGALVQVLQYLSREESLKAFVVWTMGSLGDVSRGQLLIMACAVAVGLALALAASKPLDLLAFGEDYALTTGVNPRRWRGVLFVSTTLLAGTVTAFCGPIGFVGMAMPHVARALLDTFSHRVLLPGAMLCGAAVMLIADILSKLYLLPVNAVTSLLGIPIVVWVVVRSRSFSYR